MKLSWAAVCVCVSVCVCVCVRGTCTLPGHATPFRTCSNDCGCQLHILLCFKNTIARFNHFLPYNTGHVTVGYSLGVLLTRSCGIAWQPGQWPSKPSLYPLQSNSLISSCSSNAFSYWVFNIWYKQEHILLRLNDKGFLSATRMIQAL